MAQQTQNPKTPDAAIRKPKVKPLWLWFALMMGSAAIHAALAIVALPLLYQLSGSEIQPIASVPIELMDLPAESAKPVEASAQTESKSALASIAASPSQSPSGQNTPAPSQPAPEPAAVVTPSQMPQSLAPVATVDSLRVSPLPRANSQGAAPPAQPESAESAERTETGTVPGTGARSLPQPTPTETPPIPPTVTPPTETPGFATIPIEVPTPDVSETLPIPPSPASPSPVAQVEVNRENAPVNLTVSLDFERISVAEAGDNPDQLAAPEGGVASQEISTLDEFACAGVLKPEILQSLGVKVALQISTDISGQVIQIAAQVPSRNVAYNELARCLVQHWDFVPAEEAGEPVPSNALRVWVTIDRS